MLEFRLLGRKKRKKRDCLLLENISAALRQSIARLKHKTCTVVVRALR